jgi:hypothetical protein
MWEGLAPDGGVSVSLFEADPPLSGASPLPQLIAFQSWLIVFLPWLIAFQPWLIAFQPG